MSRSCSKGTYAWASALAFFRTFVHCKPPVDTAELGVPILRGIRQPLTTIVKDHVLGILELLPRISHESNTIPGKSLEHASRDRHLPWWNLSRCREPTTEIQPGSAVDINKRPSSAFNVVNVLDRVGRSRGILCYHSQDRSGLVGSYRSGTSTNLQCYPHLAANIVLPFKRSHNSFRQEAPIDSTSGESIRRAILQRLVCRCGRLSFAVELVLHTSPTSFSSARRTTNAVK